MEFPDGAIGFPEWARWYIPRRDVKRVRPLVPHKFYKLYGICAPMIRRMSLPVAEALNIIKYKPWREKREESLWRPELGYARRRRIIEA
jgi:hypothetical protein